MLRAFLRALPLALFASDALAWGLQTHVCFAQLALTALPFAGAGLRAAAQQLPRLVLAGACLPDLFLAGAALGTPAFARAHRWSTLRRLGAAPSDERDQALAVGYASHLVTDVIAHNNFVPEHEARIARMPHVTHALAEWAMDRHLSARLPADPGDLLAAEQTAIADFVARAFRCDLSLAQRALNLLGSADSWLRASPLPRLCHAALRLFDRHAVPRLDSYVHQAAAALPGIEPALTGAFVDWVASDPEGHSGDKGADRAAGQHVARVVQAQHHP